MSIDISKNKDTMLAAWREVVDDKIATDWALFGYEGQSNVLTLLSKGGEGIDEMKDELNSGKIMYAFIRVMDPKTSLPKYVLINWQGEGAPLVRKGTCANHIRDVGALLKGAHVTINARNEEEVDIEMIIDKVSKTSASSYRFTLRSDETPAYEQEPAPVGTVYRKVIAKNEINIEERDKFWQKEEEEERRRQHEERKRQEEAKRKLELEIKMRESEEEAKRQEVKDANQKANSNSSAKDAHEVIRKRSIDARAVFEQNTAAGQMLNSRTQSEISAAERAAEELIEELKRNPLDDNSEENHNGAACANVAANKNETVPEQGEANYEDLGLKAEALYDYQAADDSEISFDPGDIICHIEQIDPGWWQGLAPDGTYGLFPANYVQLMP